MIGIRAKKNSNPEEIWEENFKIIRNNLNEESGKLLTEELYEHYSDEVGVEKIIKFLETQDKIEEINNQNIMNFGSILFFENTKINYYNSYKYEQEENEDEEDTNFRNKITKKNTDYNFNTIKLSLLKYFLNELVEDIPTSEILRNKEDVLEFTKMFQIKFLYEYLIPISELKDEDLYN